MEANLQFGDSMLYCSELKWYRTRSVFQCRHNFFSIHNIFSFISLWKICSPFTIYYYLFVTSKLDGLHGAQCVFDAVFSLYLRLPCMLSGSRNTNFLKQCHSRDEQKQQRNATQCNVMYTMKPQRWYEPTKNPCNLFYFFLRYCNQRLHR